MPLSKMTILAVREEETKRFVQIERFLRQRGNSGKRVLLIAKHRRDEQGLDERIGFGRVVWGQDCGGFLCGRLRSLWRTPPAISYSFESLP